MDTSEIKHFEQELAQRTLKLSEAMRIGARIRPQTVFAGFLDGKSCALAAAYEGCGFFYGGDYLTWAINKYPKHIVARVVGLNDAGGLTRERIADWLESQGH